MPLAPSLRESMGGVPRLPCVRVLALAVALLGISIGGLEAFWREQGYRPNVPDTIDLWSFWRTRVYSPCGNVVVFLGTSRIRGDVDLDVLERSCPAYRCVQLGVSGNVSPIGTLRSLSLDAGFRGVVICELAAPFLERSRWIDQQQYFLQPLRSAPSEPLVYAYLRDNAAVLHPALGIAPLLKHSLTGQPLPSPSRCRASFDRSLHFSDAAVTRPRDDELTAQMPVGNRSLMEGLAEVRESVRRIQARQGSVVFVGLPTGLPAANATNSGFNDVTWARIAEITGAICIPLETGDSLGPFRCSDNVHLGKRQARRLTECLVTELRRNHLVD
jgi:hypothetical protein